MRWVLWPTSRRPGRRSPTRVPWMNWKRRPTGRFWMNGFGMEKLKFHQKAKRTCLWADRNLRHYKLMKKNNPSAWINVDHFDGISTVPSVVLCFFEVQMPWLSWWCRRDAFVFSSMISSSFFGSSFFQRSVFQALFWSRFLGWWWSPLSPKWSKLHHFWFQLFDAKKSWASQAIIGTYKKNSGLVPGSISGVLTPSQIGSLFCSTVGKSNKKKWTFLCWPTRCNQVLKALQLLSSQLQLDFGRSILLMYLK